MSVPVGDLVRGYYWLSLNNTYSNCHIRRYGDPNREILGTDSATLPGMKEITVPSVTQRVCQKCYGLYLLGLMSR
jgi:hypothetical protein